MPPKFNASDPETAAQISAFKSIGLSEAKALEVARAPKQAAILSSLITQPDSDLRKAHANGELDEKKTALLLSLCVAAGNATNLNEEGRRYALGAILDGRLKSNEQVSGAFVFVNFYDMMKSLTCGGWRIAAAVKFLDANPPPVEEKLFNPACGVGRSTQYASFALTDNPYCFLGIELSPDEIRSIFLSLVRMQKIEGWANLQAVTQAAKTATKLRWAPPLEVKNAADSVFTELFGPKEAGKPKAKV